jgi:hypothetical protein
VNIPDQVVAGTAAVQYFYSFLLGYADFQAAVGPLGLFADYAALFGSPRVFAIEPLIPGDLVQPLMHPPYDRNEGWYFTSARIPPGQRGSLGGVGFRTSASG